MKKILFALPALAFTLFLAFCQKSHVQEEAIPANTVVGASDRGPCTVYISADNTVSTFSICGLPVNNNTSCYTCSQLSSAGVETFSGHIALDLSNLTLPVTFSVRNTSSTPGWITVSSGGVTLNPVYLGQAGSLPGNCAEFTIDQNCIPH